MMGGDFNIILDPLIDKGGGGVTQTLVKALGTDQN